MVAIRIDKESPLPIYQQIAQWLRQEIVTGHWEIGDAIPSEEEMCRTFHVSRGPIRAAVAQLAQQGYLERQRGRGTFVTSPGIERDLAEYMSLFKEIESQGMTAVCRLIQADVETADPSVARALAIPAGSSVVYLHRLFEMEGEPLCVARTYLPTDLFPGILQHNLARTALWDVLTREFGQQVRRITEEYGVVAVRPEEAKYLETSNGTPALFVKLQLFSEFRTIEFTKMVLRSDRCRLKYEYRFQPSDAIRRIVLTQ